MVIGLNRFRQHFAPYANQYVLIGGTACTVIMQEKGHLTPIPINETVASLSAILLDDDYYNFIHLGKQQINDLSVLDAVHLIPLKARAYIDLMGRKQNGENIDEKDIRKHKNDVIRLYQLLSANSRNELPLPIKNDMSSFLNDIKNDKSIDCKNLGLKNVDAQKIIEILGGIYGISFDVLAVDNPI